MPEYSTEKAEVEATYKAYSRSPDDTTGRQLDACLEKASRIRKAAYEMSGSKPSMINTGKIPEALITLDELYVIQTEVEAVHVPDAVNELFDEIVVDLRTKGITISDRKYFNYTLVVKAQCWLSGSSKIIPEDLKVLKNYLWDTPQEIDVINQTLDKFCTNQCLKECCKSCK